MAQEVKPASPLKKTTVGDKGDGEWFLRQILNGTLEFYMEDDIVQYQYTGFDPKELLKHMYTLSQARGFTVNQHRSSMCTLAAVGTLRGNKISKIILKTKPQGRAKLEELKQVYGIVDTKPDSPLTVTLARISASMVGTLFVGMCKGKIVLDPTINPAKLGPEFPASFCLPGLGSIIPISLKKISALLLVVFIAHQVEFDKVINPRANNRSSFDQILRYVQIQVDSNLFDDKARKDIWGAAGALVFTAENVEVPEPFLAPLMAAYEKFEDEIPEKDKAELEKWLCANKLDASHVGPA